MLSKIKIKNYALINELEIDFNSGFSAITGETGAGKSIILGALGLTLGERVDGAVLNEASEKCVIETWFGIKELNLQSFFVEHELDYESESILRREILPSGKSRAFINDTPVSLAILKQLSEKLIDVHSQHQTLLLNTNEYQLSIVDANAKNYELKKEFKLEFEVHKKLKSELENLKEKEAKLKSDLDYFQFQFDELDALNLEGVHQEEMQEELDLLNNAEFIKSSFNKAFELLDNELGIISQLQDVSHSLSSVSDSSKKTKEIYERIQSSLIELEDVKSEIEETNEDVVFDSDRIEVLTEKLNLLQTAFQKHRTESVSELVEVRNGIEENLVLASNFDSEIEKLSGKVTESYTLVEKTGGKLTKSRTAVFKSIESEINEMLLGLGMKDAQIQLKIENKTEYSQNGIDSIQFLFKANKGGSFNPIAKVASGGELSRLMLCIKTNLAQKKQLPSLIFDEIDTGVSGDIASKMAEMMRKISANSQVLAITHLPQIASKGDSHFKVYKTTDEYATYTKMKVLDKESRVVEIAKMLSGSVISDAALDNAKSLLRS
ncbi:MAG: DNA repair protein RecN [Flavobacteriales bacterium]